jgi:dienelactone hydrolase
MIAAIGGGLHVIVSQVIVDAVGVIGFGYSTLAKQDFKNVQILTITSSITVGFSGNLTNRWTMIFPMIPLLILQILRSLIISNNSNNNHPKKKKFLWMKRLIGILSLLLIVLGGMLSVLFPPVELPPSKGKYSVGIIDTFLPINMKDHYSSPIVIDEDDAHGYTCPNKGQDDHVTVRILYPTLDQPVGAMPYLRPATSIEFCEESMTHSAPPPLRKYSWIIHYWRLAQVANAKLNAKPLEFDVDDDIRTKNKSRSLPIIFYSHGLGGNSETYTYQTRALAANGYVVVVIDHTDGSSPVVLRKDGNILLRDESVREDYVAGRKERYKRSRRAQTEYRAAEFLHMVEAFLDLNIKNIPELDALNISFVNKLNPEIFHYMGHSFGGATVFHAARQRRPTSIISHEPAAEWLPDATRGSLFDWDKVSNLQNTDSYLYTNVTDNYNALHDIEMLVLFSGEWGKLGWGGVGVLQELSRRGKFGPDGGSSNVQVIEDAHHQEFADVCMLTPLWLGRATKLTNTQRNPVATAEEIHEKTISFIEDVEKQRVVVKS